jgi:hypothetical protein
LARETSEFDLDQPANVLWIPEDQIPATRSFASLRDAVHFVMGELVSRDRAIASITTDQGVLTIEQMEKLFGRLSRE